MGLPNDAMKDLTVILDTMETHSVLPNTQVMQLACLTPKPDQVGTTPIALLTQLYILLVNNRRPLLTKWDSGVWSLGPGCKMKGA